MVTDSTSGQSVRKLRRLSTPRENGLALAGESCKQDQLPSVDTSVLLRLAKSAAVIRLVVASLVTACVSGGVNATATAAQAMHAVNRASFARMMGVYFTIGSAFVVRS